MTSKKEELQQRIKHRTDCIPNIIRNEVYELDGMEYTETFDDVTGERQLGTIRMYNGIRVGLVGADGTLSLDMPTNWVTNHADMMNLISDIINLDEFLTAVCENYH